MEATAVRNLSMADLSKQLTARSANARTRKTSPVPTVKDHAVPPSTRATATAATTTTTVAATSMEATAVRNLPRAERSTRLTAKRAFARIPRTKSTKTAKPNARLKITSAMATAMTRTTIVPVDTIKATVAVQTLKKLTARNVNAKTRSTKRKSNQIRCF